MTTYPGPWIQAPDYEALGEWANADEALPTWRAAVYEESTPPGGDAAGDAARILINANRDLADMNLLAPNLTAAEAAAYANNDWLAENSAAVYYDGAARLGVGGYWVDHRAVASVHFQPVVASRYHFGVGAWYPGATTPVPPDVVGFEWMDGSDDPAKWADALGAVGTFFPHGAARFTDGRPDPGPSDDLSVYGFTTNLYPADAFEYQSDVEVPTTTSDWTEDLNSWGGVSGASLYEWEGLLPGDIDGYGYDNNPDHGTHPPTIHHDRALVDISGRLDEQGRAAFASRVWVTGDVRNQFDRGYDTVNSIGGIVWTFRPPVFRWLYATPQITSAPPLRHTQRDDRHGPSPRNRPARSRQAGQRNTGYL